MSFVAEMTLGLLGVSVSSNNFAPFVTMLLVTPESAQASSFDGELKVAKDFAVVMGMDYVVVVLEIQL